jgi:hypothetical protein
MAYRQRSPPWPFSATLFNREGGEISMLDLLPKTPSHKTRQPRFPFSFIPPLSPSFRLFLPDHAIEVLPLHFPELILAKKESLPAVPENLLPRSLISLDLPSPLSSARDCL